MNRLVNIILVLSVLATQSAWAIHGSDSDTGNTDQFFSQPVHTADQHSAAADGCNHFCHASAHLVGLFSINTIELQSSCDSHQTSLKRLLSSLNYQPPIPPPIT